MIKLKNEGENMSAVFGFINEVVKKHNYLDRELSPNDHLKDDLGLDSLGILTLLDELEEEFEVSLEPEELQQNHKSIGELVNLIESKLQ